MSSNLSVADIKFFEELDKLKTSTSFIDKCVKKTRRVKGELVEFIDPASLRNFVMVVALHPLIAGVFCWDEFSKAIMVVKCPPWMNPDKFKVHPLDDDDVIALCSFQSMIPLSSDMTKTAHGITLGSKYNTINPAKSFFSGLVWDGKPRLDSWLKRYCGCTVDDPDYVAAIGRKWLVAAVARIYRPGTKFDSMIVLEGKQGIGKSTALKVLATFGKEKDAISYFTDNVRLDRIEDRDETTKTKGKLIVEIAEMANFSKKDEGELKKWLSMTDDEYRVPYERNNRIFARQFIVAGTINPIDGYLKDPTGNRRYWPVMCTNFDIEALRADKDQLWAEAVHVYKKGESLYLDEALYDKANKAASHRFATDTWADAISELIADKKDISIDEILKGLGFETRNTNDVHAKRIGRIMTQKGWERRQKRVGHERVRVWVRPDAAAAIEDIVEPKQIELSIDSTVDSTPEQVPPPVISDWDDTYIF
jgi:predicted P-loop ATPase